MANLLFQNKWGQERVIAEVHTYNDITTAINTFIDECNQKWPKKNPFKCYYIRMWNEDGRAKFDVGSWSEFFYLDCPWPEGNEALEKEDSIYFK